jgi:hypothetical protein
VAEESAHSHCQGTSHKNSSEHASVFMCGFKDLHTWKFFFKKFSWELWMLNELVTFVVVIFIKRGPLRNQVREVVGVQVGATN